MANVQLPDALLVKSYVAGDENALAILINRHQSKIYGFIYSKVSDRDITDDIFQDTFIKVIKTLKSGSYNEEGKFLPWVMRIYQDLSFKEISELTGVSINTALGRMRYALMNLRKVIDKHQIILTN